MDQVITPTRLQDLQKNRIFHTLAPGEIDVSSFRIEISFEPDDPCHTK